MKAALVVLMLAGLGQQSPPDRIVAAVRQAMAPALPFPDTDAAGAVPANNSTEALWMVRPLQPGDRTIEVSANPLNEVNQQRAARAMRQIESNVASAQRRAAAQYDAAVAEAKRSGRSQEVDGVTLNDEGVAGAKIDAESRVLIEVMSNQPDYTFEVLSSVAPAVAKQVSIPAAVAVIVTPSNTYRDDRLDADRYAEADTQVFLGRVMRPEVTMRGDNAYSVSAAAIAPGSPAIVVRLRGNEVLIADILRKTDWNSLLELLK